MVSCSKRTARTCLLILAFILLVCGLSTARADTHLGTGGGTQPPTLATPQDPIGGGNSASGDPDEWEINQHSSSALQPAGIAPANPDPKKAPALAVEQSPTHSFWLSLLWQLKLFGF
jgi:hypothetical protein